MSNVIRSKLTQVKSNAMMIMRHALLAAQDPNSIVKARVDVNQQEVQGPGSIPTSFVSGGTITVTFSYSVDDMQDIPR